LVKGVRLRSQVSGMMLIAAEIATMAERVAVGVPV
jgi:hypothetical protein